ncbi:unnamed protein product [Allacma fusca]|uniref:C2H2-type domain-containing protein n=1 Tax=Allacma fusca TaxID=39272 RepID=A0A8J2JQW4_9HEXA|nr:unnamed protein product [Allacma fusca]
MACCCCSQPCCYPQMPVVIGQPCNGGCCCRLRPPLPVPLQPPCCQSPFPTFYKPRPCCPQRCNPPPSCWCHPCLAPPPCCRPGAYNPRIPPPRTCPQPCCCQPCKVPPRCMPPPCQPCRRPCCPRPVLLPIPAYLSNSTDLNYNFKMACCACGPIPCGGIEYLGGCGIGSCCKKNCCFSRPRRVCEKLPKCFRCPPSGFPAPPLGCGSPMSCGCCTCFPPFPCEPHPCYPISCRRVPKCSEWPSCPCGRPFYRPLGPPKLCYRPLCVPPCPDCPLPRASPIPCYPRLFRNCKYCPRPRTPCYFEKPPSVVRDTFMYVMDEEANTRQRHLEREIACLKDTIWRLTSRVCVVETFLKNKYGQIVATPTISLTQSPVKVIPIVIPNSEVTVTADCETETEIVVDDPLGSTIEVTTITRDSDEGERITGESIQESNDDFSEAFGSDFQPNTCTDQNISEGGDPTFPVVAGDSDVIRIYKPELKTFVTVKAEVSERSIPSQISRDDLECHICQKKFSRQENVQRHMLLHRAAQFTCEECGRGFNHQGNLNTHKLRHERMNRRRIEAEERIKKLQQKPQTDLENRKFPCSFCEKRFYTAQQRNIHTRIHTGEKPFECNLCGMRFNQKASLFDHSLGHAGEKNNYCHLCPAGFVRSRNLLKHIRQVHKMAQIKTILNGERLVEFVPESEAAAIIESRKGNMEVKKPPKPRARKRKQMTAQSYSTRRSTKITRSEEETSPSPKEESEQLTFEGKCEADVEQFIG